MRNIQKSGFAISASKMVLFQTKIRFFGHDNYQGTIKPIMKYIALAVKFLDEIKDKKELQ